MTAPGEYATWTGWTRVQLIELILDYRAMDTLGEERTCQECHAAADEVLAAEPGGGVRRDRPR